MTEQIRPTFLRRRLGAKLRRLREQAGLTLEEAAPRLDKKKSALHRIETGQTKADVHFVRSLMDIYDCYDPDLVRAAREAARPPWFRAHGIKKMGYVEVETEAVRVDECALLTLPGLLQTRLYIRALFMSQGRMAGGEMERHLKVRMLRQLRLSDSERPLTLTAVVHEAALHREVGGPEVMRGQLRHLVEMARLPNITLRLMPLRSGACCGLEGSFILLGFPDPEDPELLYVEYAAGSLHIENPNEVATARMNFARLREEALSPAESVVLIKRLASELYP